jgi:hypothetical protein
MIVFVKIFRAYIQKRKRKRDLQEQSDRVYHLYDLDLAKATTQENREEIESLRRFECAEYDGQIDRLDSLDLAERARRCHIDVSDIGPPPEHYSHHWIQDSHGTWFLHPQSFRALSKTVEEAEYQRAKRQAEIRDFRWKVFIAVAAVIGALTGIVNLLVKIN